MPTSDGDKRSKFWSEPSCTSILCVYEQGMISRASLLADMISTEISCTGPYCVKVFFKHKIVIIFLPIHLNMCFGCSKNRLIETVLLNTHCICFG